MAQVYISIGSNIDREKNIASSMNALEKEFGEVQRSSIWRTAAVGFEGDSFYNLVVRLDTSLEPLEFSAVLRRIEDEHGRVRDGVKFGSRSLDLDLLLYDDLILDEPNLKLPRSEIMKYAFVLRPLAEIAGSKKHPVSGISFSNLWYQFDSSSQPMWPVE